MPDNNAPGYEYGFIQGYGLRVWHIIEGWMSENLVRPWCHSSFADDTISAHRAALSNYVSDEKDICRNCLRLCTKGE